MNTTMTITQDGYVLKIKLVHRKQQFNSSINIRIIHTGSGAEGKWFCILQGW